MQFSLNKSKLVIFLDLSWLSTVFCLIISLLLPFKIVNANEESFFESYYKFSGRIQLLLLLAFVLLLLFIVFYILIRLHSVSNKFVPLISVVFTIGNTIILFLLVLQYQLDSLLIGFGLFLVLLFYSAFLELTIFVLSIKKQSISSSLQSITKEYFAIIKNILEQIISFTAIFSLILLVLSISIQSILPKYGSFLNFTDAALLIIILWSAQPYNYFLQIAGSKKTLKIRFQQLISFSQNAIIILLLVLAISSIKLGQLLQQDYLNQVVQNFNITVFIIIFILLFVMVLIVNILDRFWEAKTKHITEFVSLLIVLAVILLILDIFGNPLNQSAFTIPFFISILAIIVLLLLPWKFQFNTFLSSLFRRKSSDSEASKIQVEASNIIFDSYNKYIQESTGPTNLASVKTSTIDSNSLSELYTSSLIYKFVDDWMTKYISLSIIILAFLSTISFLQEVLIPTTLNANYQSIFSIIIKIVLVLSIFFGSRKENQEKSQKDPGVKVIQKGDASTFMELLYSKTALFPKILLIITFFSFPVFTIIIFTYMLSVEINLVANPSLFVFIMIVDIILSFSALLIAQKGLVPDFIDYFKSENTQSISFILLILAPLSIISPFILFLTIDNLNILILLSFIHIVLLGAILIIYDVFDLKIPVDKSIVRIFFISMLVTFGIAFIFIFKYMDELVALVIVAMIILVSIFYFNNLKVKTETLYLKDLIESKEKGWDEVWKHIEQNIEYNTRPASFYNGKKIKFSDFIQKEKGEQKN